MTEPDDAGGDDRAVECTLDEATAERRQEAFEEALLAKLEHVERCEGGVELTFSGTDETLEMVTAFVRAESDCCSFADFEIAVDWPYERTRMTMTGPEGADEFIAKGFEAAIADGSASELGGSNV